MKNLMLIDIGPAIVYDSITEDDIRQYSSQVLDRFCNPFIDHKWTSISMQYSSRMKMRNLPVLLNYYERFKTVPEYMALGFAAYLLLMKVESSRNGYTREINGSQHIIEDDKAAWFCEKWKQLTPEQLVVKVLEDESLWGTDLSDLDGFTQAVNSNLKLLMTDGSKQTIKNILAGKTVVQS